MLISCGMLTTSTSQFRVSEVASVSLPYVSPGLSLSKPPSHIPDDNVVEILQVVDEHGKVIAAKRVR